MYKEACAIFINLYQVISEIFLYILTDFEECSTYAIALLRHIKCQSYIGKMR